MISEGLGLPRGEDAFVLACILLRRTSRAKGNKSMYEAETTAQRVHPISQKLETDASGVSWAAVFAGALAAGALYLILLSLGAGLGLSTVSPWAGEGASATAFGASAIVWLIVTEVLSSAMGGYLAGRLRTKWAGIHSDEVYFRDTAHGFLAWCTALVFTAAFLGTAATALVGHSAAAKAGESRSTSGAQTYFVDKLLRSDGRKEGVADELHTEVSTIFARSIAKGSLSGEDKAYLDQLVTAQTGASSAEADGRVGRVFAEAQESADAARSLTARTLLWMFVTLLLGAFTASLAATIGGRQRDHVVLL